jgi:ribosomal protein L11 methyltransferase
MPECHLNSNFLIKRRHQRQTPPRLVYDIGQQFRLIYGPRLLEQQLLTTERLVVRIATSLPATFGAAQLHQTTRWSIEMLEKYYQGGYLLDVGTGAGLLAICAAKLSQATSEQSQSINYQLDQPFIEAFDIYNDAIKQAEINLRLNSLSKSVNLRCGELAGYPIDKYSLVIGNLPPIAISSLWPDLITRLAPNGRLILSGLLKHNLTRMREKLSASGLMLVDQIETDLWCLLVAQRS